MNWPDPEAAYQAYQDGKIKTGKESVSEFIALGYDVITGSVKYLDVSQPHNAMFFGRRGSGKSVALQAWIDAHYTRGYVHAIFHDLHGEFNEKHKENPTYKSDIKRGAEACGISERRFMPFADRLPPFAWEKKHIRRFTPEFIKGGEGNKLSLSLMALPKEAWTDRIGYTTGDRHKRRAFEVFYDLIDSMKKENPNFRIDKFFLDSFFNDPGKYLDEKVLAGIPVDQIKEVVSVLETDFIEKGVIEGEYVRDLNDVFSNEDDVIFDFSKLDLFSQLRKNDALDPRDLFVTVSVCQYFEWVRMMRAPPYNDDTPYQIVLEEMQRIFTAHKMRGSQKQSMALQALGLFTTQSRKYGVGMCVAFQAGINQLSAEVALSFDVVYVSDMPLAKGDESFIRNVFSKYRPEFDEFGFPGGRPFHFWVFHPKDEEMPVSLIVPYPNRSKKSKENIVKGLKLGNRFNKET